MNKIYDAIVVGGGPAGLSAAIYLARAKFSVLVIDNDGFGGQIKITAEVVNYPGVYKTSGKELTMEMKRQAEAFGASFLDASVTGFDFTSKIKEVHTSRGDYKAVGLILATGSHPRKLGFKGEEEYQGRGVAYCATCDGEFFTGKDIFVIGGGFAAAEEAIFLTKYGKSVTVVVRGDDFSCAKSIADKVKAHPRIKVLYNTTIKEALGASKLRKAVFINSKTNEEIIYETLDTFGIFVFAGYEPETALFKDFLELSKEGNLITDETKKTNIEGVYGAGDVCVKPLRQVVTAVADGALAATSLEKYIPSVVKELQIETLKPEAKEIKKPIAIKNELEDSSGEFISSEIKAQLKPIIETVNKELTFVVIDNDTAFSKELIGFSKEFKELSSYFNVEIKKGEVAGIMLYSEGKYLNVTFHTVPGGHEFNSFVVAIFNAVGRKQPIAEEVLNSIKELPKAKLMIFVSLSCTMCPELVMAAARVALLNEKVTLDVYDISKFPEYRKKYDIMSVPALLINDSKLSFGKKDLNTLISMLK